MVSPGGKTAQLVRSADFCYYVPMHAYQIPALVLVPTGELIKDRGKTYPVLKLQYDLEGKFMPLANPVP